MYLRLLYVSCVCLIAYCTRASAQQQYLNSTTSESSDRRSLQGKKGGKGGVRGGKNGGMGANKEAKVKRLMTSMKATMKAPEDFIKESWSPSHNPSGFAVLTCAMSTSFMSADAIPFLQTLRNTGFDGDIVVGIEKNSRADFLQVLKDTKSIAYTIDPICEGEHHGKECTFKGYDTKKKFSINMIRFHLYNWWSQMYDDKAILMVADFRDVFFQSNPFKYHTWDWAYPVADLVVFQEVYPNKVISRCPFNGGWVKTCYGDEVFNRLGSNTVSCSGVSMGTSQAISVYSYLVLQQLNPTVRYGNATQQYTNEQCKSVGMDQGFHNYIVYSGTLSKFLTLKIYQQGEGPVNTVGAFFGERAIIKMPLKDWKVLKGDGDQKVIVNYNGDPSPCIHQADRFLGTEFAGGYKNHIKSIKEAFGGK